MTERVPFEWGLADIEALGISGVADLARERVLQQDAFLRAEIERRLADLEPHQCLAVSAGRTTMKEPGMMSTVWDFVVTDRNAPFVPAGLTMWTVYCPPQEGE